MSATAREPTVTTSPLRINNPICLSLPSLELFLMNFNAHLFAVLLHLFPILGDFALRFGDLCPSDRGAARGLLHHADAIFHRTDVIAKPAAHTILFAHMNAGARTDGFLLAVGLNIVGERLHNAAV